ncbi:hypothetical protein ABID81_002163 [Frigoribacterium sp. PvP054]|uniref:hypothetical protein n=1 Tax=Frigoribacterium sp. PvP054 TaxID=3156438 RepID=UPI0033977536
MDTTPQTSPIMDGSDDATNAERLAGLQQQVDSDLAGATDDEKAEHLRVRMAETDVQDEPDAERPDAPAAEVDPGR